MDQPPTQQGERSPCVQRAVSGKSRLPQITAEARCYAVKELARRAGVSKEFFQQWTIDVEPERTTVSFGPETGGEIAFLHQVQTEFESLAENPIPIGRAGWFAEAPNGFEIELILPFCNSREDSTAPLYHSDGLDGLTCPLDVLASVVLTLARAEETICEEFDEHGRFPAKASLAWRNGFLERPILDEHGAAFAQAITAVVPRWRPVARRLRVKLTHDIDEIGIPFDARSTMGHSIKRHNLGATLRDFASAFTTAEPEQLTLVRKLAEISNSRGLHSAFYWKAGECGPHDSGYDAASKKVQRVIDSLRESGFELGVHPGYDTYGERSKLASEVEYLREALRVRSGGGRQHYLRWSPETWLDWEACRLCYDSSVGFAEAFGFRAGTAFPYRPWCFSQNREIKLIEIPLILMDCTPVKYMEMGLEEGIERIRTLVQRVAKTGGLFTLLWHNTPLMEREYEGWYETVLDLIAGAHSLGAVSTPDEIW